MLYVTEMLRWGESDSHHYVLGVYSTHNLAAFAGEVEKTWRGGTKYDYRVVPVKLNAAVGQEQLDYHLSCIPEKLNEQTN